MLDYVALQRAIMAAPTGSESASAHVQTLTHAFRDIPAMAKADARGEDAAAEMMRRMGPANRGPKAVFFDPLSLQYSLGYKDRRYSLTYDTLKRISHQVGIVAAIINTRIAQIAAFAEPYRLTKSLGFAIKHKSPDHLTTQGERDFIKQLEAFVLCCYRS